MSAWTATIVFTLLLLALLATCIRLVRGPSMADRVVALELVASVLIGMLSMYAVHYQVPQALDVALVLALTGFLAAIGVSRYLVRRSQRSANETADSGGGQ
jgi:multicomponent Na+:H+ antiporter subunit F